MVLGLSIVLRQLSQEGIEYHVNWMQPMRDDFNFGPQFLVLKSIMVQYDGIGTGCIFAVLVYVIGSMEDGPLADELLLRAFFGFALGVCTKSAIDGATIDLNSATPPKYARFYLGWTMGSMWGVATILTFWPLMPIQFAIWLLGGAFFGFVIAKLQKPQTVEPERLALYDLDKEIFAGWKLPWRIVPSFLIVVALTALVLSRKGPMTIAHI